MITVHHGSSSDTLPVHPGLCLTEDEDSAADYARSAFGTHYVHEAALNLDGLTVIDADGDWDRDENTAASDLGGDYDGADIITYDDETPMNRRHVTYRLMTPAALAALTAVRVRDAMDI